MDGNSTYFNHLANPGPGCQGAKQPSGPVPRQPKQKNGAAFFFGGFITGIAGTLMIVGVCCLVIAVWKAMRTAGVSDSDSAISADVVSKLQKLEYTVKNNFYLHEVTNEELQNGLYKGLLAALDDPYSEYYSAVELQDLIQHTQGIYYGIGAYIQVDKETGLPLIARPMPGSPAEEAGIRAQDIIYEVDGVSTYGMSLTDVVALIKGPENTNVTLTLAREGESDYLKVDITRRKVENPTVESSMKEDGMAYIKVSEFDEVSINQFADALAAMEDAGMKGLILDLRSNPGGSLNAVVEMAKMILPKGMIVYTEDKEGKRSEYICDGSRQLAVPLAVLVDGNSASASEIMAGAIKDYGLGTLVGTTTFGKGIVQQIIHLQDGSAVKVTISAYYTPNGNNIHGVGIEPDVLCEFDSEAYYGSEDRPDNQLEKAKEVLKGLMK